MNDLKLSIKDSLGNIKNCEILLTFNSNNKNYIIYTDNTYDTLNKLNIYAGIYYKANDGIKIDALTNKCDYDLVESKIAEFING